MGPWRRLLPLCWGHVRAARGGDQGRVEYGGMRRRLVPGRDAAWNAASDTNSVARLERSHSAPRRVPSTLHGVVFTISDSGAAEPRAILRSPGLADRAPTLSPSLGA